LVCCEIPPFERRGSRAASTFRVQPGFAVLLANMHCLHAGVLSAILNAVAEAASLGYSHLSHGYRLEGASVTRLQFWKLSGNAGAVAILAGLLVSGLPYMARATVVDCPASKDNTIFKANTNNSNGSGDWFAAGKNNNGQIQRALIQFDLSAVPVNATILSATVDLYVDGVPKSDSGANARSRPFWLRAISGIGEPSWGEGTSNAGIAGQGVQATSGDATWLLKQYPSQSLAWPQPGVLGDSPRDPAELGTPDGTVPPITSESPQPPVLFSLTSNHIVSEVQQWVRWTAANDGWILVGEETVPLQSSSRRQFTSREFSDPAYRPVLRIEYTAPHTLTWSGGGGGSYLWTANANWGGATAAVDSYLQFGPSGMPSPISTRNDFAPGAPFRSLTFTAEASAYTLQGNRIRLSGPVRNLGSSEQAIGFDVELVSGGGTFDDQGGTLTMSGAVSGTGPLLKTGLGELVLTGVNSYTGGTVVSAGTLTMSNLNALPVGQALTIQPGATVVLDSGLSAANGASAAATPVPEPGTLVLLAVAAMAVLGGNWSKRARR
jgi:autotransporter-associated beta strand protein